MKFFGHFLAVLLSALVCVAAPAQTQEWAHKAWRVSQADGRCTLTTGGDGDDYFNVSFAPGGVDAAANYEPLIVRGYPVSLALGDEVALFIDAKENLLGEEMGIVEDKNKWGEYRIAASLSSGFVAELTQALRRGNKLEIRKTRGAEAPRTLAKFSLNGFTATLLKAASWCRFDPKKLP
jgi:hypothetical protein